MIPIVDARAFHSIDTPEEMAAYVEQDRPGFVELKGPRETSLADAHAVARINWGRWLADCPAAPCANPVTGERAGGAEYVSPGLPFMCQWCWNQEIAGRFREVDFPAAREALEAELVKRDVADNRNWTPGETLADLQADNIVHGVAA
jgi:hypothetical protein